MARNDWYRRETWSESDQKGFFERLRRSRTNRNKAQYARIQAVYLERAELLQQALELLLQIEAQWPEPSEMECVYWQRARCLEKLRRLDEATEAYRLAIGYGAAKGVSTGAWKDYCWFVASQQLQPHYEEVLALCNEQRSGTRFPVDEFKVMGAQAMILENIGRAEEAARCAARALEASREETSGFRYHPGLGLVSASKYMEALSRLRALATAQQTVED